MKPWKKHSPGMITEACTAKAEEVQQILPKRFIKIKTALSKTDRQMKAMIMSTITFVNATKTVAVKKITEMEKNNFQSTAINKKVFIT